MATYTHMIDMSTPETRANTCREAAEAARRDAAKLQERAAEMRVEAGGLEDKPSLAETAEDLVREATAMEEDAEGRLGMASFYDNKAEAFAAEATRSA